MKYCRVLIVVIVVSLILCCSKKPTEPQNNSPTTPGSPTPANGATDQAINVDLSWSGGDPDGDPVTYDVYFGTSSPPPSVSTGQAATTYDPGTLSQDKKYYWKIVAEDDKGAQTEGSIWDFTTGADTNNPPNAPSNPSPSNGAANQSITVDLGWTGGDPDGDPVIYDVYFGTSATPPLVSSNQTQTTYNPGTMSHNTMYYWKIVAEDSAGAQTEGVVWSFTTEQYQNDPPYAPSNPSPSDGATDQSINVNLSWTGGDPNNDPVIYDVYFGTASPPPLVSSDQTATSYDPGTLNYHSQYYWKIVAEDTFGAQTQGNTWDFTTASASWEEYKDAHGTYYNISGNFHDPDPVNGLPWIALSSYGTDGAEAYWVFNGLNEADVETLIIGSYSYDDGWDAVGEEYWVYNNTTSIWDYWGSSDKTAKWHLWYTTGNTARNYVRSSDGAVFLQIKSGYPDHTHIRQVYCREEGLGAKDISTSHHISTRAVIAKEPEKEKSINQRN